MRVNIVFAAFAGALLMFGQAATAAAGLDSAGPVDALERQVRNCGRHDRAAGKSKALVHSETEHAIELGFHRRLGRSRRIGAAGPDWHQVP